MARTQAIGRPVPPPRPFILWPLYIFLGTATVLGISHHLNIDIQALLWGLGDISEYIGRFGTPELSNFPRVASLMAETLAMAVWGTALAVIIAVILAPLAARNLSPNPILYRTAREALNALRALPDLLFASIFVAALGLGPLPGVLAIGLHSAGFLGKVLAEILERVDVGTYEAMRSVGENFAQIVMWAGWPSALQEAVGYTIFLIDRNVRVAAILGLVGAGGIGMELTVAFRLFQYDRAAGLILVLLIVILSIDYISDWARRLVR